MSNDLLVDIDDVVEGETYIKPNIEIELSPRKRKECRDILLEIKNFGISQRQLIYLIYIMSLELESSILMKKIVDAINTHRSGVPLSETDKGKELLGIPEVPKSKLIIPT